MPENRSAVRGTRTLRTRVPLIPWIISAVWGTLDAKIRIRHMDGAASALGFDRDFLKQLMIE